MFLPGTLFAEVQANQASSLIDWVYSWQTLIGGILGGVIALLAAVVVAMLTVRRDVVASGMLIISDLGELLAKFNALVEIGDEENLEEDEFPRWFAERLLHFPIVLSPSFDASVYRLRPVNNIIALHLSHFSKIFYETQIIFQRIRKDYDNFNEHRQLFQPEANYKVDCERIAIRMKLLAGYAERTMYLIDLFVTGRLTFLNRLRFWKTKKEKEYIKFINNPPLDVWWRNKQTKNEQPPNAV